MSSSKHLKIVKKKLYKNLRLAYKGLHQWRKITKIKNFDNNTAVVLLPDCNRDVNYLALLYLDAMLKNLKFNQAVILTSNKVIHKCANIFSNNIIKIVSFNRKKAEQLMQYFCLYEFDKRLIIASIDEPNGRNGSSLIGKRGTTLEEIFVIGVYRIYPFQRPNAPKYIGNDNQVKDFLEGHVR